MTSIWIHLMQLLMIAFWGCKIASPFFLKGAGRSLLFEKEEFDSPEEGDFPRFIRRGDSPPFDRPRNENDVPPADQGGFRPFDQSDDP